MTQVFIFLIVAAIAILSAAFMLFSKNAVHSAMFLVLNFACVAFFFLTLSAPFIALMQIAVYAGAIMVLFLFVIMLLGAEQVQTSEMPYQWLPRAALILALVFMLTAGWALSSGEINNQVPPSPQPQLRVVNAVDTPLDIYLNNELFVEDVRFREATGYMTLPAGAYGVQAFVAGADSATEGSAILGDITLAENDVMSLVTLGSNGTFALTRVVDNPNASGEARLTMINGLPDVGSVDLVNPGLPSDAEDDAVIIAAAGFGEPVETLQVESAQDWTLNVLASGEADAEPLVTYHDLTLARDTNTILIPAPELLGDGTTRVVPVAVSTDTEPEYGSPQAVGLTLYTRYLLPFELVSILLLAAVVGAVVLTRRELLAEARPRRPVVRRPLVGPGAVGASDEE